MDYIITDGKNYITITSGAPTITTSASKAHRFGLSKANNILLSQTKIMKKYQWQIKEVASLANANVNVSHVKNPFEDSPINLIEKAKEIQDFSQKAKTYHDYLVSELSNVDLEISDIEHKIEFTNFNVVQGYKIYKMLQTKRLNRRHIKNELDSVGYIMGNTLTNYATEQVVKSIAGLETRQYKPRKLKELFE